MPHTLTITLPTGDDLDTAVAALMASDLGGNSLDTIRITAKPDIPIWHHELSV